MVRCQKGNRVVLFLLRIPINPLSSKASAGHLLRMVNLCVCVCIFGLLRAACCADAQFDRTRNLKDFSVFICLDHEFKSTLFVCVCVSHLLRNVNLR